MDWLSVISRPVFIGFESITFSNSLNGGTVFLSEPSFDLYFIGYELEYESGKVIHHNEAPNRHPDEFFMVPDILLKKFIYQKT